jgi:hypothetical protein
MAIIVFRSIYFPKTAKMNAPSASRTTLSAGTAKRSEPMTEKEMEDLIASYPAEFFPRRPLNLKGRQGTFCGIGRYDLLFEDHFKNNLVMELKAVPAKLEVGEQLVKYKQALAGCGKIVRSQQFLGWFESFGNFRASES